MLEKTRKSAGRNIRRRSKVVRKGRIDTVGMHMNWGRCIRNACEQIHVRKGRKDVLGKHVNRGMCGNEGKMY